MLFEVVHDPLVVEDHVQVLGVHVLGGHVETVRTNDSI